MPALAKLEELPLQKTRLQSILFATDFSDASKRALPYALAIAQRSGATLSIMHALGRGPHAPIPLEPVPREMDGPLLEAEQQMKEVAEHVQAFGIAHQTRVERGPVWDALFSTIQREDVDLLVLGTHGRGGLTKLLLGSVAEEVLRMAPCPVLTVGKHVTPDGTNFRRILFATDFGPGASKALPYALSLAEDCAAKLTFLHTLAPAPVDVMRPNSYGLDYYVDERFRERQAESRQREEQKLKDLVPRGVELKHQPDYVVVVDVAPDGILQVAKSHKVDLIVVGANRTSATTVAAHLPWTVIHRLVCEATCPVLTVAG